MKKRIIHNWDELPLFFGSDIAGLMLNINANTITKMAAAGEIPAKKVGRFWRFEKDRFRKFMEG